jgi:excisionase family DNA binding protein
MDITSNELYQSIFREYPDVMDVSQVSDLLGVSTKTVYKLIGDGTLSSLKVGRAFRIPKVNIMRYLKVFGAEGVLSPKS